MAATRPKVTTLLRAIGVCGTKVSQRLPPQSTREFSVMRVESRLSFPHHPENGTPRGAGGGGKDGGLTLSLRGDDNISRKIPYRPSLRRQLQRKDHQNVLYSDFEVFFSLD